MWASYIMLGVVTGYGFHLEIKYDIGIYGCVPS